LHEKAVLSAAFRMAFSCKKHGYVPHLACFLCEIRAKSGKMVCQMPLLCLNFLPSTPCENELFAADGQIMAREGSHNVKKRCVLFY